MLSARHCPLKAVGALVGATNFVGAIETVGDSVAIVGDREGTAEGCAEGSVEGWKVGAVGADDTVGAAEGTGVLVTRWAIRTAAFCVSMTYIFAPPSTEAVDETNCIDTG
jgi:hypothetical protein